MMYCLNFILDDEFIYRYTVKVVLIVLVCYCSLTVFLNFFF
jgi:hypothetical protein